MHRYFHVSLVSILIVGTALWFGYGRQLPSGDNRPRADVSVEQNTPLIEDKKNEDAAAQKQPESPQNVQEQKTAVDDKKSEVTSEESIQEDAHPYPFILRRLSSEAMEGVQQSFAEKNSSVCAYVGEYGIITDSSSLSRCKYQLSTVAIADQARVVAQAKQWLVDNAAYTNVHSISDLVVADVMEMKGCRACSTTTPDWYVQQLNIVFSSQMYHGLPFAGLSTNPTVIVRSDAQGVWRVFSGWYPNISVPTKPKISEETLRKSLVGVDIKEMDAAMRLHSNIVKKEDVTQPGHLVIYVVEDSQGLAFHLAWGITVQSRWIMYFDALTGKKLGEEPLFRS